ncbi:hypothetical protein BD311DRAFT_810143 [Dichomitus squalens]|uniref:Peptidase S33 tripeptidyl aminopeptidase-like C-terminal domain-containing protein n=1 Tax=Dichomitus squalens TaxID=114155 RepID=A0A4Q9MEQ6_9APHY|nr:hypothetical protein BD311DRAFT_810143 [Dichomitus squalens]
MLIDFQDTTNASTGWPAQLTSSDDAYKGFFTGCALTGDGPLDVNAHAQDLLNAAHSAETANASVPITSGIVRTQILWDGIYVPSEWINITNQLLPQAAQEVQSETLAHHGQVKRAGMQSSNSTAPTYTTIAILCGDAPDRTHANGATMKDVFETVISTTHNVSHMFGDVWPNPIYTCAFWPERAVERYTGPFNRTLANKILVVGNTYDPVTLFIGAKTVADFG